MDIRIEHFDGKYPSFNVALASAPGKPEFLTVKGCRLVEGSKGTFVSWPATKNEKTGKYWSHVWANEAFAAAVLEKATAGKPKVEHRQSRRIDDDDEAPF